MSNQLDNYTINKLLKDYKRFKGCYMKDQLPTFEPNCYYIINLQSSTDGEGTHWCCLYVVNSLAVWFDPMGHGAPKEIEEEFDTVIYDDIDLQDYEATTCGYFCMGFIVYTYYSKNILNALKNYNRLFTTNLPRNDKILKKLLGEIGSNIKIKD